jgi:peptidylprolyl isomerase
VKRRPGITAIAIVCASLGIAGCGDDDDDESASTGTAETQAAESPDAGDVDTSTKPKVEVPAGEPPPGLQIEELKEGDGATATGGSTVTVQYVGVSYSTAKQFDASWDTPGQQPYIFTLGAGEVIPGWDQGVAGMKVGGRRRLTIPPELGYGETGQPPDIAPNETLIFVIDLLDVG